LATGRTKKARRKKMAKRIANKVSAQSSVVYAQANPGAYTVVCTAETKGTAGNSIVFTESSAGLVMDGSGTLGGTLAGTNGGEAVGTGDNSETVFALGNEHVDENYIYVYLDATLQTKDVDYTLAAETGVITFASPPGAGVAITASYYYFTQTDCCRWIGNETRFGGFPGIRRIIQA
jgi:hypothetical protein